MAIKLAKKKGGDLQGRATRIAEGQVRKSVRDLKAEKQRTRQDIRRENQKSESNYLRSKGDLEKVYGETGRFIGDQQRAIDDQYQANISKQAAAQASLKNQLDQNFQNSYSGISDEFNRMGLSGINLGGLVSDHQQAQNTADLNGSAIANTLQLMNSGSRDLGNLMAGMNKGSFTSAMGQALNHRNTERQDLSQRKMDEMAQIRRQIRNTKASRGDLITQVLETLRYR